MYYTLTVIDEQKLYEVKNMKNSIGQNISKYRKKCNLTQAELAEKMNVSIQAVSKWENDVSYPDLERIGQLAVALNTSAECIINGEGVVAKTQLDNDSNIANRLFVVSVNHIGEQPVDVTLRLPMELVLKSHKEGTLSALLGEYADNLPDSIFEMISSGIVGSVADVKTEDTTVKIEVVKYDY